MAASSPSRPDSEGTLSSHESLGCEFTRGTDTPGRPDDDTAHRHVHIIANRVHPETTRAWSNSHDYRRLEVSLRKQAEARGLPYVPGRFNDPEKFCGKGRGPRDGDYQAAVRHGKRVPKSMWSKDDIAALRGLLAPIFTESTSWSDLSAHVDFAALAEAAHHGGAQVFGPRPQGTFLEGLGIEARTRRLIQANPSETENLTKTLARLTAPDQMGNLFQAMALLPPSAPPPPGF